MSVPVCASFHVRCEVTRICRGEASACWVGSDYAWWEDRQEREIAHARAVGLEIERAQRVRTGGRRGESSHATCLPCSERFYSWQPHARDAQHANRSRSVNRSKVARSSDFEGRV